VRLVQAVLSGLLCVPVYLLARRLGLEIRWLEFDTRTCRYSMHQLDHLITKEQAFLADWLSRG
jgi:selenocysteine lyase/cysteine desulfurase